MPSEERVRLALEAVAEDRDAFRSAVAGAVDEVGSLLETRSPAAGGGADRSLGRLAEGRIDAERFAGLFEESGALDPEAEEVVGRARDVLAGVHRSGEEAFLLRLEPGADLRDEVGAALGRLGRAFGAARTVDLARSGRWTAAGHGGYLEAFPPGMWNAEERAIAPPLVVRLRGDDLRPAGLSRYLDGGQAIVLLVEGEAPPASLVRLVTPGTLVVQDEDPAALSALEGRVGPAAAALFPEGSDKVARFVHDPGREGGVSSRLTVSHAPDDEALRPVGSVTRSQQAEELGQLRALAAAAEATAPSGNGRPPEEAAEPASEPADRLAGWLLRQSGLDDLEG